MNKFAKPLSKVMAMWRHCGVISALDLKWTAFLAIGAFAAEIVTLLLVRRGLGPTKEGGGQFSFVMFGIVVIGFSLRYILNFLAENRVSRIETNISAGIRKKLLASYLAKPAIELANYSTGALKHNIHLNSLRVAEAFKCTFQSAVAALIGFGYVLVLLVLAPNALAALAVFSGLMYATSNFFRSKLSCAAGASIRHMREISSKTIDIISNIKQVKSRHFEDTFIENFESSSLELSKWQYAVIRYRQLSANLSAWATSIITLGLFIFVYSSQGTMTGSGLVVLFILQRLIPVLTKIDSLLFFFSEHEPALNSAYETLDLNPVKVPQSAISVERIELKNICYAIDGKQIIKKCSALFKAGDKIWIDGPTGVGKTTLLNLVSGVYSPLSGSILVNGRLLTHNQRYALLKTDVLYLGQLSNLFDMTIRENLLLGNRRPVSDQEIWEILSKVGLEERVRLIGGLDREFGSRGSKLSGGESQRLLIANAMIQKPRVLLLDEATNALDERTEIDIMSQVYGLMASGILIFSSHAPRFLLGNERHLRLSRGVLTEVGSQFSGSKNPLSLHTLETESNQSAN